MLPLVRLVFAIGTGARSAKHNNFILIKSYITVCTWLLYFENEMKPVYGVKQCICITH